MKDKELSFLRRTYSDIIQGFSSLIFNGDKILIKHFTSLDQGLIDADYEFHFEDAIKEGLPNIEERLNLMIQQGLWGKSDEAWIANQKFYIDNLAKTKSKMTWQSQIEEINKQITEAEVELKKKEGDKKELLGLVAESYASKKVNENYIYHSFRKENINERFFSQEDFDELSIFELNILAGLYTKTLSPFNSKNIKKIGLASFFQSSYSICGDNPQTFFGKSVCDLTFYQSEIFTYGRFFKSILSADIKPDDETLADPDKLIDWYMSSKNAQDIIGPVADDNNGATHVFGAKKSDITAAGAHLSLSPVQRALKDKKGLSMEDVIRHHGL